MCCAFAANVNAHGELRYSEAKSEFFLTRLSCDKIEIVLNFRLTTRTKKWILFFFARLSHSKPQSSVGFSSAAEYKLIVPLSRVGDLVSFIAVTCRFSRHFYYFSA